MIRVLIHNEMQLKMKIILASMLMALMATHAFGNTPVDSVKVYFQVGSSLFDPALRDNGNAMESFIRSVKDKHTPEETDSIVVRAYASPEGTSTVNERLSQMRCKTVADLLIKEAGINPGAVRTMPEGVAWNEFRRLVATVPDVPSREKVLYILDNVPIWIYNSKGAITDGRKKRLMELDRGETYRWLQANIFPELRNSVAIAVYAKGITTTREIYHPEKVRLPETNTTPSTPLIPDSLCRCEISNAAESLQYGITHPNRHKRFFMAVKTNILFDALLVPNIGAEFYLGKNVSVSGEWMYAWWDRNSSHYYWRTYGGDLGLRWWFGRKAHAKPLTGHHLGLYGGILTFDFELGNTGYMGGKPGGTLWDRWIINTGIEYGYSLPIGRRLNIDFSIGLGYMGGNYIKYYPFDNDYFKEKEYKMRFFGPTKAEISLVWLLGRGNANSRKGGGQ